jgi:two-component system KDP operon response regulator KdpE
VTGREGAPGSGKPAPIPTDRGASILLVEDDDDTRATVAGNLAAHGWSVREAGTGHEALRLWELVRPDILVLDLGLPDMDGLAIVRAIRREATTPILILSARDQEHDKVEALELGADDYLAKPFGLAELRARIGALLRRAAGPAADPAGILRLGPVTLDIARHSVEVSGTPVDLTPREFELLKLMMSQPGRLLTRGRLLRAVWGGAYSGEAHYLHVYVSRLRRKLADADPAARTLIVAEPGVGYRIQER